MAVGELLVGVARAVSDSISNWIVPPRYEVKSAILVIVAFIAMTSRGISSKDAEQLTQLLIGILCTCGLLYFSYIELINPTITVSDRLFTTLVALIVASVGLREFQYRFRGQDPPSGESANQAQERDGPGNGD